MSNSDQDCLIALGGNMPSEAGDPAATLRAGLARLAELTGATIVPSRLYHTPCFPAGAGPDYVNAAARLAYPGDPHALLADLHQIEMEFGRTRAQRWGQRTLDLDLIAVGQTILPDPDTYDHWRDLPPDRQIEVTPNQLILPHPRMQDRAFVLVPLADVAPEWVHPSLGLSVLEMRDRLPEAALKDVVVTEE